LVAHDWPGNIRELENVIERSMIISPGSTLVLSNPSTDIYSIKDISIESLNLASLNMQTLEEVQRAHILAVCEDRKWKIDGTGNAADVLGIHPNTLRSRMNKLGISRPEKK
jgi:DNA-binding NtrC family response regulator